eukprot:113240-Hanusia_phi.AAC.3
MGGLPGVNKCNLLDWTGVCRTARLGGARHRPRAPQPDGAVSQNFRRYPWSVLTLYDFVN